MDYQNNNDVRNILIVLGLLLFVFLFLIGIDYERNTETKIVNNNKTYSEIQKVSQKSMTVDLLSTNHYILPHICGKFAEKVAVVGCSMGNCRNNITKDTVRYVWRDTDVSINQINIGDIVFVRPNKNKELVHHRVYDITQYSSRTLILKGDNNSYVDNYVIGEYELLGRDCVKE